MKASVTTTPAASAAAAMASTSSRLRARGFSQSTCLPAWAAAMVSGAWRWFGSGL